MRLAPGAPLTVALAFDEARPPEPVTRLAMAGRLAQLEWSAPAIGAARRISPIHYLPEPGLQHHAKHEEVRAHQQQRIQKGPQCAAETAAVARQNIAPHHGSHQLAIAPQRARRV